MPAPVILALPTDDRVEVDAVSARAGAAGARVLERPAAPPWGGYAATFADPDGHLWQVAREPGQS